MLRTRLITSPTDDDAREVLGLYHDDDLRWVLSRMLLHRGFRVIAAKNGDVARSLYDTMPCDAVLVDLHMPVFDGFGLIEHVRRTAGEREMPILVFSGSTTGAGEARALALGANVFITKPVSANTLIGDLSRLLAAVVPRG